jgi:hypothetical protein
MTPHPLPYRAAQNTRPAMSPVDFARQRLMNAQANGVLPKNFNIAQTGHNVLGQFHQLAGAIGGAKRQTSPTAAHELINNAIGGLNGHNNIALSGASHGQGPQYGAFNAHHPMAAPGPVSPLSGQTLHDNDPQMGQPATGGLNTLPNMVDTANSPLGALLASMFGQGTPDPDTAADPRSALLQHVYQQILGGMR